MDNQLRPALCHRSPGFYTLLEDRPNVLNGVQDPGNAQVEGSVGFQAVDVLAQVPAHHADLHRLPLPQGCAPGLATQASSATLSLEDPDGVFDLIEGAAVGILWGIDGRWINRWSWCSQRYVEERRLVIVCKLRLTS